MENVVTAIFAVESEAYKAFSELRARPFGVDYIVAEAALVKRDQGTVSIVDAFDAAAVTSDDTATGMLVGSIVGILGGPLGVLLGASVGALAGSVFDGADAGDSLSMLEVTSAKLVDGECAIIALVQEEEPAFDAALEGYDTTIMRYFAADVLAEVDRARELGAELVNEAKQQLRAEKKAERQEKLDEQKDAIKARFAAAKQKAADKADAARERHAERKETFDAAADEAEAAFVAQTKEMMGE